MGGLVKPRLYRLAWIFEERRLLDSMVRGVSLLLVLLPVVFAFLYVHRFGVNVPYHDQWAEIPLFRKLISGRLELSDLFALHNEHRIFFPRVVMLLMGVSTAYNVVAEMYFIQACAVVTLIVFWLAFRDGNRYRLLLFVPVAFLLFSLRQHSSMLQGIQIVVAMTQTAAVLAFYCLHLSRNEDYRKFTFPVALVSGTVASFSFLQGLFVWPVGFLQLLIVPMQRSAKRVLVAVWALVGGAEWFLYFFSFSSRGDRSLDYFLYAPLTAAKYLLTLAGGSLFWRAEFAWLGGLVILGLSAIALFWILRSRELGDYSFWIAVLSFVVFFMLAAMIGRLEAGAEQAITSRYVNFSILLPISVYAILVKISLEKRFLSAIALLVGMSALILSSLFNSYERGLKAGAATKESREKSAFILSTYRSQPSEVLATLSPQFKPAKEKGEDALNRVMSKMERRAALLDRLDYSVFAEPLSQDRMPSPSDLSPLSSSTPTSIDHVNGVQVNDRNEPVAVSREEAVVTVTGWAIDADAKKSAGGVYVEMDERLFPAFYGLREGSVAKRFGIPAYAKSGFEAEIPILKAEPGIHRLTLIVLTHDEEAYYRVPGTPAIMVKE
jgi:hypothetical protein